MGTRGLLGFEKPDKKIYFQYLQFDSYPTSRGKDFYEEIVNSISEVPSYFIGKDKKPNKEFFKRVKAYLDNESYSTGHSINNHGNATKEKWPKLECWQEWQYWFDLDGNFNFFPTDGKWTCTIPWEFTRKLIDAKGMRPFINHGGEDYENPMGNFWKLIEKYGRKGNENPPSLVLEYGEVMAFPDQKEHGYRSYGVVDLNRVNIWYSTFSNRIEPDADFKEQGKVEVIVKET